MLIPPAPVDGKAPLRLFVMILIWQACALIPETTDSLIQSIINAVFIF